MLQLHPGGWKNISYMKQRGFWILPCCSYLLEGGVVLVMLQGVLERGLYKREPGPRST